MRTRDSLLASLTSAKNCSCLSFSSGVSGGRGRPPIWLGPYLRSLSPLAVVINSFPFPQTGTILRIQAWLKILLPLDPHESVTLRDHGHIRWAADGLVVELNLPVEGSQVYESFSYVRQLSLRQTFYGLMKLSNVHGSPTIKLGHHFANEFGGKILQFVSELVSCLLRQLSILCQLNTQLLELRMYNIGNYCVIPRQDTLYKQFNHICLCEWLYYRLLFSANVTLSRLAHSKILAVNTFNMDLKIAGKEFFFTEADKDNSRN